jgi:hypothetical protein
MRYVQGLRANFDSGEGEVVLPTEIMRESDLWRMDVIRDWIYDLTEEYSKARVEFGLDPVRMEFVAKEDEDEATQ